MGELDDWAVAAHLTGLGPVKAFSESEVQHNTLLLSFHYHSVKLLICRPCLCRLERNNKGQSDTSADFCQKTAEACAQAAHAITNLFAAQPGLHFVYEQSPWWCIIHYVMQAIAVFLLKLSLGTMHTTHRGEDVSESVKKLLRWLWCMSASNDIAERAYEVVINIINTSALYAQIDTSDNPAREEHAKNRKQSIQSFYPLSTPDLSSPTSTSLPSSNWSLPQADFVNAPIAINPQTFTSMGGQRPMQEFDVYPFNQTSTLSPSYPMPSVFGNPFLNLFDSSYSLSGMFPAVNDDFMNDVYQMPSIMVPEA